MGLHICHPYPEYVKSEEKVESKLKCLKKFFEIFITSSFASWSLHKAIRIGCEYMRRYYSSRKTQGTLNIKDLYKKLYSAYLLFESKDYFKHSLGIRESSIPHYAVHTAALALNFSIFPVYGWSEKDITEDNLFDALEFFYDHVSKPGNLVDMVSETNFYYQDYENYDPVEGKDEFRSTVNSFLCNYRDGYELSDCGEIQALGDKGLEQIFTADIPSFDPHHVDEKVKDAIHKWKNRHLDLEERRKAIRELADVFEWLKKANQLTVLDNKDEAAIFEIANRFGLRHHNPEQKTNYDKSIWYSWMFHFYLATYHAVIRLIEKKKNEIHN